LVSKSSASSGRSISTGSPEVREHEQLGALIAARERVDLLVPAEQHRDVAVSDRGLLVAQLSQGLGEDRRSIP
jgi:hypothetical protein